MGKEVGNPLPLFIFDIMREKTATLYNEQTEGLAFKISSFQNDDLFNSVQRHNYYSIILLFSGTGELQIELTNFELSHKSIICISPYQPYSIIEKVLFHNEYSHAYFPLGKEEPLINILNNMEIEIESAQLGQHELLVAYLKIFLILIIRMKKADQLAGNLPTRDKPEMIEKLVQYINAHYKEKHSATDYATLLNVPANTLGSVVKKYFDKTLTALISDRIMVEAKRELYLTSKSVKEISYLLGYQDEYYFSRFFKRHAGISQSLI